PRPFSVPFLPVEVRSDILHDRRHHGFDHVAGFRGTGRHRGRLDRRQRYANPGSIDVAVTRVALVLIDQNEAAGIAQAFDVSHRRNVATGWQQHGEAMVQALRFDRSSTLVVHCHIYVTGIDGIDLCIGNPLDVPLPELRFHQALRVADPAEPHVPDVRLARHEGYRHLVPDTALAQVLVQDQRELVSRAEATGALHGADDDGTRVR